MCRLGFWCTKKPGWDRVKGEREKGGGGGGGEKEKERVGSPQSTDKKKRSSEKIGRRNKGKRWTKTLGHTNN